VASGKSASEAYRRSGATGKNADVHAARLMVNDSISKRIAELKAAQAQKSELSRDELREFLIEVILTPAGKVSEESRLCQSYKATSEVREIRMPDKLRAVEQLAKLCGFNEPEKMEIEHGYKAQQELVEVIARLRGRGAAHNDQSAG
jgi:Terminase small subunit